MNPCQSAYPEDCHGIGNRSQGKLKLLPDIQRSRIGNIADVKIGRDAQHPLLFLLFDLDLCDLSVGSPTCTVVVACATFSTISGTRST